MQVQVPVKHYFIPIKMYSLFSLIFFETGNSSLNLFHDNF